MSTTDRERRKATLYAKLIHRLMTHGDAYVELAEYTGLSYHTVIRYIKALRGFKDNAGDPLVRVAWFEDDKQGRPSRAAFKLEPGGDVKRTPIGHAESQRRYRRARAVKTMSHQINTAIAGRATQ